MDLHSVESASLLAWPALEEEALSYGVLRYARGVSRRANCLNVYVNARYRCSELLQRTEEFYQQRGLPSIVKVLRNENSDLDRFSLLDRNLARNDYQLQAPTKVMALSLDKEDGEPSPCGELSSRIVSTPNEELASSESLANWLSAWQCISDQDDRHVEVQQNTLGKISTPMNCLLMYHKAIGEVRQTQKFNRQSKQAACCGMAIVTDKSLGLYGIATLEAFRGLGFARRLIKQQLAWGRKKACKYAYLQVEESNHSAISLYKSLGFRDIYSYWYRVKHGS